MAASRSATAAASVTTHGRLQPLLGARARVWASDAVHLDLLAQWLPVTSAGVRDHEVRAGLGVGIGWAFVGVRGTRTWFDSGPRDHVDLGVSGMFGAMFLQRSPAGLADGTQAWFASRFR